MGSGDSKMDISNKTQNRFVLGPTNIILSQYYSIGLCKKVKSSLLDGLLVITIITKKLPRTLSYPRLCQYTYNELMEVDRRFKSIQGQTNFVGMKL